jgi:hypothetical protein
MVLLLCLQGCFFTTCAPEECAKAPNLDKKIIQNELKGEKGDVSALEGHINVLWMIQKGVTDLVGRLKGMKSERGGS